MVTQTAYQLLVRTLWGSRARDCASTDALRPNYNWVKPEDQYDISIIGEKWPAFARRLPQKGQGVPSDRASEARGMTTGPRATPGDAHRKSGVFSFRSALSPVES